MLSDVEKLIKRLGIPINEQQKIAVQHKDGPGLLIAVPGSGKTTVIMYRIANLILNHHIKPQQIMTMTFSKAAAIDMEDRFKKLFGDTESVPNFSTLHSFANKICYDYEKINNIRFTRIEQDRNDGEGNSISISKVQIIKQIYYDINKDYLNDEQLEGLINKIGCIKNGLISQNEFDNTDYNMPNFHDIFSCYEKIKKQNLYIDFDDMLVMAWRILRNDKFLRNKYQSMYQYWQVDEAQDTSKLQHEIIKIVVQPKNNIFMVGDEDQSIYLFRAACPKELLNFKTVYNGAQIFKMEQNFRSTKDIVVATNQLIKVNTQRYDKEMFTNNQRGKPVKIVNVKDEYEQIRYIINKIKVDGSLSDHAILYRMNISGIPVADLLIKQGIPFHMKGHNLHFFKHWITTDIISFLTLALDNTNINAFEKIYFKMNAYISKQLVEYIKNIQDFKGKSILDWIGESPLISQGQKKVIQYRKYWFKKILKKRPTEALELIEYKLQYNEYLKDHAGRMKTSFDNLQYILSILKMIASNIATIPGFLTHLLDLKNAIEESKFNKKKDAVILSTIHNSKGLEYKNVYLIDMINDIFPGTGALESFQEGEVNLVEEERRLMYVAMTRAKRNLSIINMETRNFQKVIPSIFVTETQNILKPKQQNMTSNEKEGTYDLLNKRFSNSYEDFKKGTLVYHTKFKDGIVLSKVNNSTVMVHFKDKGTKLIKLDFCIKQKLIYVDKTS